MTHYNQLSNIFIYPIKSLTGIELSQATVTSIGLTNDRTLMLVDEQGRFISQRKYPQLALLKTCQQSDSLKISIQSEQIRIDMTDFDQLTEVEVWKDKCSGYTANARINQWFSDYLETSVKLIKYNQEQPRAIDPDYSLPGDNVSFADGFPLLLTSTASLNDLNSRLSSPVNMLHFRPNIVVEGCLAFDEDNWKQIRVGNVDFDVVKACSRCILTTVNPQTGKRSSNGEPLKTLSRYRKGDNGIYFGMNLIPRSEGVIHQDDSIEIIR